MKLKAVPVTSLEDATVDFEQLQVLLSTPSALQALVGQARGTVTFTFAAASTSAAQTVSHGLAVVPGAVMLQSASGSSFIGSNITAVSSSSFTANAFTTTNTVLTGSFAFYWVALK